MPLKDETTPTPVPTPTPTPLPAPAPAAPAAPPEMGINRLETWIANRTAENEKLAVELLNRCGELVVEGVLYRVESANGVTKILGIPREFLGIDRAKLATGIDKMVVDNNPSV